MTISTTNNVITSKHYFGSEAEAWGFGKFIVTHRQFRVADYGVDDGGPFIIVEELRFPDRFTPAQRERWKVSGELSRA